MIRKFVLPVLSLAMLIFAIYHVMGAQQVQPLAEPETPPAQSPFADVVAGVGVVEAATENIAVGAPQPGLAAEVLVEIGQQVSAGAPLFRLDDRPVQADVKLREAALALAQAQLARLEGQPRPEELPISAAKVREAQANVVDQESQLRRGESLFAKKNISEHELTHYQQALQIARAQLARCEAEDQLLRAGASDLDKAVARAVVAQAQAQLDLARTECDRLTVRAPVAGTILQVRVHPGEHVGPPPSPAPIVLGNLQPLHVRVDIDAHDIPRFQSGVAARASVRGNPHRELTLKFLRVVPFVVPKRSLTGDITERVDTRVLQVIYVLEPGQQPIYVGQQLDVFIPAAPAR